MVRTDHDGPIPEERCVIPRQGPTNGGDMHDSRSGRVAEVESREVDEVNDGEKLGLPEMATHEEHQEAKGQEVVEDEVAADVGGVGHPGLVGRV